MKSKNGTAGHFEVIKSSTSCSPPLLQQPTPSHLQNVVIHPRLECSFWQVHLLLQDPSFIVRVRGTTQSRYGPRTCVHGINVLACYRFGFLGLKL